MHTRMIRQKETCIIALINRCLATYYCTNKSSCMIDNDDDLTTRRSWLPAQFTCNITASSRFQVRHADTSSLPILLATNNDGSGMYLHFLMSKESKQANLIACTSSLLLPLFPSNANRKRILYLNKSSSSTTASTFQSVVPCLDSTVFARVSSSFFWLWICSCSINSIPGLKLLFQMLKLKRREIT
jgi:hypothetical protein